jgi:hypothetical protein
MTSRDGHPSPPTVPGLSYARTVDPARIHRSHPAETFLTDGVGTGAGEYAATALLPHGHPHYSAHAGLARQPDPMLLLECARQAVTYAAYAILNAKADAHLLLRNLSAEYAMVTPPVTAGPTEMLMAATTRRASGLGRTFEHQLELWVTGAWAGRVRMEVSHVSATAYAIIRSRNRHGSPPSSADMGPVNGTPVAPAQVGRVRATDTLLLGAKADSATAAATLRVPVENQSLFDHAQDHVPAMVLVEAARQLAAFASGGWGGPPPNATRLAGVRSSFDVYAELDVPVEMTALPSSVAADGWPVEVTFQQAGTDIGQALVVLAAPAPDVLA